MQPISSFNSNLSTAIELIGPPGGGKTSLGCRLFPKTYVFVADLNFESGKRYLASIGQLDNIVGYDTGAVDETGKVVPVSQRFSRMIKCVGEAQKSSEVDCVFLDSATFIDDYIRAKITNAQSEEAIKMSGFGHWGDLYLAWKSIILQSRTSGKKLILSVHEKNDKDESDGIYKHGPALQGEIKDKLGALMSDVWRCEVQENAGKHSWMVRTLGNTRHPGLKNTYGLDALVKADELVQKVRAVK